MTEVPGSDNKVHNVTRRYKASKSGDRYNDQQDTVIDRSVHNSIAIVPVEEQN